MCAEFCALLLATATLATTMLLLPKTLIFTLSPTKLIAHLTTKFAEVTGIQLKAVFFR